MTNLVINEMADKIYAATEKCIRIHEDLLEQNRAAQPEKVQELKKQHADAQLEKADLVDQYRVKKMTL